MAGRYDEDRWEEGQERKGRGGLSAVEKALAVILGVIVLVLVAGSVYGLASGTRAKKLAREAGMAALPAGSNVFTAIGTIRASTKDSPPSVVVATISFPYPADDPAFAEELEKKTDALKAAALAWFQERTAADLVPAYSGAVKTGLRDSFNALLSLGKVDEIWLSDFSVIE
jgi:flagellar basal body-associated protein FliL